jgi:hypothetical protein
MPCRARGECLPRHRAKEFLRFLRRIDRAVNKPREYMEMNALRGIVKDGAGTTLYNYFTEFGLAQISVDFLLGTAGTLVQTKVREVLRAIEDNLLGESMSDVHALVSREFFDKLIAHPPRQLPEIGRQPERGGTGLVQRTGHHRRA